MEYLPTLSTIIWSNDDSEIPCSHTKLFNVAMNLSSKLNSTVPSVSYVSSTYLVLILFDFNKLFNYAMNHSSKLNSTILSVPYVSSTYLVLTLLDFHFYIWWKWWWLHHKTTIQPEDNIIPILLITTHFFITDMENKSLTFQNYQMSCKTCH